MPPVPFSNISKQQSQANYKKRGSHATVDSEILLVLDETKIQRQEAEALKSKFSRFNTQGTQNITQLEAIDILSGFDFKLKLKQLKDLIRLHSEKNKWKGINFLQICLLFLAVQQQEREDEEQEEMEFIDAFVSMGGNSDKTGTVRKNKLIDIIKNEFQLTIDIEELIEKSLSTCVELSFEDFCQIFETGGDEIKSKVSLLSVIKDIIFKNKQLYNNNNIAEE